MKCSTGQHYLDLSLCTIDYKVEKNIPVVYLFCRDQNGDRKIIKDTTFRPYFYIRALDLNREVVYNEIGTPDEHRSYIQKIEFGYKGLARQVNDLAKIVCDIPYRVRLLREKLNKPRTQESPVLTFEADILFCLRYLIDKGIKTGIRYYPNTKKIESVEAPSNFRVLYIDIEIAAKDETELRKFSAPCIIVGMYDSYSREYTIFYHYRKSRRKYPNLEKPIPDFCLSEHFYPCHSEIDLLSHVIEFIRLKEPDVIVSFTTFDMIYLLKRCTMKGIDKSRISPIRKVRIDYNRRRVLIGGIEYIDCLLYTSPSPRD